MSLRDAVQAALQRHAATSQQAALLGLALAEFDSRVARSAPWPVSHRLPALVDGAVRGAPGREALCVVTAVVEMGIDVLDHIADDELGPHWAVVPPGAVVLAATGLVGVVPHLLLAELEASAETKARLHAALARGLPRVGGGQQRDLSARSPEDALAALDKTGERYALYAELAAIFAGHPRPEHYAELGRQLGRARQLASDASELASGDSRDLAAGVWTWPVAWAVQQRPVLAERLPEARQDPHARRALAEELCGTGVLRRAAFLVEVALGRAEQALEAAGAQEPGRAQLVSLVRAGAVL